MNLHDIGPTIPDWTNSIHAQRGSQYGGNLIALQHDPHHANPWGTWRSLDNDQTYRIRVPEYRHYTPRDLAAIPLPQGWYIGAAHTVDL